MDGKQQQLEEADAAWWQLWGREALSEAQVHCALQLVQEEPGMGQLRPVTGSQLRRAALSMGSRKAGGADGLQAGDWSQWPRLHWDKLAQFVQMCEQRGQWPKQLLVAHVSLLRKGDLPVDKLQARPITISPLIYRAWAKVRARQLKVWMEGHTELLVGCRQVAEF